MILRRVVPGPTVALLLAAGCAEAPPAAAPLHPRAFQQFCEQAASLPQANALAIARGAEGFELVAMYNGVLCYKRPVGELPAVHPQGAPAPPAPAPAPASTFVPVVRDPGF